jgi:hypothetical protein
MVARVRTDRILCCTFSKFGGDVSDTRQCRNGDHAALVAMGQLVDHGPLQVGDQFLFHLPGGEPDLPEASRGSDYS